MTQSFSRAGNLIWEAGSLGGKSIIIPLPRRLKTQNCHSPKRETCFHSSRSCRCLSLFLSPALRLDQNVWSIVVRNVLRILPECSGVSRAGLGRKAWECPGLQCMVEVCPFRLDLAWHLLGPGIKAGREAQRAESSSLNYLKPPWGDNAFSTFYEFTQMCRSLSRLRN